MNACEADLRELERKHNRVVKRPDEASLSFRTFASPDQSCKLVHALAGKEVTETTLLPVCEALVGIVVASVECRNTLCHLQDSRDSEVRRMTHG
jgi:hypothetical protein